MSDTTKLTKVEAYLSNERTLLSYMRTAASVAVLAVAMFKFFEDEWVIYLGFAVLLLGVGVFVLGTYRFIQGRKRINSITTS
ncbi:MAG: DUF202 domain-containing protein [Patescibacteria group bacterium]